MIDLDEIFLKMLKIFLTELKFILLYCINRITPGHLKGNKNIDANRSFKVMYETYIR